MTMNPKKSAVLLAPTLFLGGLAASAQEVRDAPVMVEPQAPASAGAERSKPAAPALKPPRTSNKWRIEFDESSKSDGVITFRVWTLGTTFIDVLVSVRDNQGENSIARSARDAFRAALGPGYKVETDDGEDVLIKVKGKTPHFGLALVGSTAKDVDIDLERE